MWVSERGAQRGMGGVGWGGWVPLWGGVGGGLGDSRDAACCMLSPNGSAFLRLGLGEAWRGVAGACCAPQNRLKYHTHTHAQPTHTLPHPNPTPKQVIVRRGIHRLVREGCCETLWIVVVRDARRPQRLVAASRSRSTTRRCFK